MAKPVKKKVDWAAAARKAWATRRAKTRKSKPTKKQGE